MSELNPDDLEKHLRQTPRPQPPRGLKERLIMNARSNATDRVPQSSIPSSSWLRRWWPVLVPAGVSLACMAVLGVQQMQIRELQRSIDQLSKALAAPAVERPKPSKPEHKTDASTSDAEEIQRLKQTAQQLSGEVSNLEKLQGENQKLRAQLAAPVPGLFTPEETEALAKAKERAEEIRCVNNLKQIGLAARIWSNDNKDIYPPDVISMSNELSTPMILVCPGDYGRSAAANFSTFTMANCSYEFFLNPPSSAFDAQRVLTRCPIHGTVGLCDGSVQMKAAKEHPDWLIQRDGKLYFEVRQQPSGPGN
jgi:hypothetical protein